MKEGEAAISPVMGVSEWLMLIGLSLLWGGSFFFVGVAVSDLPVLTIVALRVGLAAAVLWGVVLWMGRTVPRAPAAWLAFLGMGVLNNVIPFGLIVWGQQSIASGLASILNATTPLFGVIVAGLFLRDEAVTPRRLGGAAVGFAGVSVMIGTEALAGLGRDVLAQAAVLAAALSYAFAGVFGRRFRRLGVDPVVTAAGQVSASSLLLLPAAILFDRPWALPAPAPGTWAAVTALAVLSTAAAYILYFRILERAGATNLLLVTLLIPVSALLLGALFLGERPDASHVLGMALIGAGLVVIDGRLLRRRRRGRRGSSSGRLA